MVRLIGDDETEMGRASLDGFAQRNRALFSADNRTVAAWTARSEFRRNRRTGDKKFGSKRYFPYHRGNQGGRGGFNRRDSDRNGPGAAGTSR